VPIGTEVLGEVLSVDRAAAYMSRSLILGAAAGLARFYWYSWDIPSMGLTEGKGKSPTFASRAYITTERWLRGAVINDCRTEDDKLWICSLTREGRQARLVWNTTGARDWAVPESWRAQQFEMLLGGKENIEVGVRIQLHEAPILVISDQETWGTQ
jgi:hypothetical protein